MPAKDGLLVKSRSFRGLVTSLRGTLRGSSSSDSVRLTGAKRNTVMLALQENSSGCFLRTVLSFPVQAAAPFLELTFSDCDMVRHDKCACFPELKLFSGGFV